MPEPGGGNHRREVRQSRLPAQYLHGAARVGQQGGRIARAARRNGEWNLSTGNSRRLLNHLTHRCAAAAVKIENMRPESMIQVTQGENMGFSEVGDVDVVAQA